MDSASDFQSGGCGFESHHELLLSQLQDMRNERAIVNGSQNSKIQTKRNQGLQQQQFIVNQNKKYDSLNKNRYDFPNYFETRKVGLKVTEEDEKIGKVLLLNIKPETQQSQSFYLSQKLSQDQILTQLSNGTGYQTDQENDNNQNKLQGSQGTQRELMFLDTHQYEGLEKLYENEKNKKHAKCKQKHFLLIYGVGTKREFINRFIVSQMQNIPCLIINGFHSATNIKSISQPLVKFVQKHMYINQISGTVMNQLTQIKQLLDEIRPSEYDFQKICLVIHSMDIGQLKNKDWQLFISELVASENIMLITSVDHIKSNMLWSDKILDNYNFYSIQIDTFEDYDVELDYQPPLFSYKNDNEELGLQFVLKSMTKTQIQIIQIIAQYQLENDLRGISMKILVSYCVESMIAYSTKTIKDMLSEAFDHKVLIYKPDANGENLILLNYPQIILERLVSNEIC
eukprot:403348615